MSVEYDQKIGFSALDNVDQSKMQHVITTCKQIIIRDYGILSNDIILVAGAGNGTEATLISESFMLRTVGVDLNIQKPPRVSPANLVTFQRQDLNYLAFMDNAFAIIYCYHVLEHVLSPFQVLSELKRVLKPDGVLFIGFPNKNRLISYIGTSQKATFREKLLWNFKDYENRLLRKFENRYGAHAGFTEKEYIEISSGLFSKVIQVRNQYMINKYSRYHNLIQLIINTGLSDFLFPSNYFICKKG